MAESRLSNFNICCRLCLSDTFDNLKSNFVDAAYYPGLQLSMASLLGVKIVPDDKLSTMVCLQCIEKINNWQSIKLNCCENQAKLEQWMNTSIADLAEMSVHVKEEPIDHEKLTSELIIDEDPVKNDSVEEEYNEFTPPLTPQGTEEDVEIVPYSPLPHFTNGSIHTETVSRMEESYIEKCKAMVMMYGSLRCACHNVSYQNFNGLLSHLRSVRIWFPVFTCFHCMITFTDSATNIKHYSKCRKENFETLIKLSNLKKRSEIKTRLYQNYKCTKCGFMYSFYEDFCTHVDEEHGHINLPFTCTCGRVFNSLDAYKDHAYATCLLEFYCDICHVTVRTLEAFQKHAAEVHDNAEGFGLLQEDNYPQRRSAAITRRKSVKRELTDRSNIISGKRRSCKTPITEVMREQQMLCHETMPVLESISERTDQIATKKQQAEPPQLQLKNCVCNLCGKAFNSARAMGAHQGWHTRKIRREN